MSIEPLKELALIGALGSTVTISSAEFARRLGASPQTASRKLQTLEQESMIKRRMIPHGQEITITEQGILALQKEYLEYQQIFGDDEVIELTGTVCTGLGEGRYYVTLAGYLRQFEQELGFTPFPGTFNIELDPWSITARKRLDALGFVDIEGFDDGTRTFGSVKCFKVKLDGVNGAIVIPNRKNYPDNIIEIIARVNLREHLDVSDSDEVKVILCRT
jgi:riboflavin kinase